MTMNGVFLVGAKRTPFGSFGGSLKKKSATELGVVATKAALSHAHIDPQLVDTVFVGNVSQSAPDSAYIARHIALKSGCKQQTPCLTVNRICGSGLETAVQGASAIRVGDAHVAVCGGTESLSDCAMKLRGNNVRWGIRLGADMNAMDDLWDGLFDSFIGINMGMTAENLAREYGVTREESDAYVICTQQRWLKAKTDGVFDDEIAPVKIATRTGARVVDTDEEPRQASMEQLSKLPLVFDKKGVVTAASSSGVCDGAGSIILASEDAVKQHGLEPLCRLVSYGIVGCDPAVKGIGPVAAIKQALFKAGLTIDDVDRFEINEVFAPQFLACVKKLGIDMDRTNVHGGAISLGHPLAASGSRIAAHLANEFKRNESNKIHVCATCVGGGQGVALVFERV